MENTIKKIRLLIFIALSIILLESIVAFGALISGYMYREFDQEKAETMLEYIKENNPEYYEKLTSDEDSLYIKEFFEFYEKKGHPLLIAGGFIILALSINTSIPLIIMLFITSEKKEEEQEEEQSGESEEGKEGEF